MTDRIVLVVTRIEAAHLAALVGQFADLLRATEDPHTDEAVARLVPDAYSDDADAADEFRAATESDLLTRRATDAVRVLASIGAAADLSDDAEDALLTEEVSLTLDAEEARAWLRTLAAVRLVLASRLGIEHEDDHDPEDARYGIYDWIGFRLNGLVEALDR